MRRIIIVGSGIGGSALGALLSKDYEVLLFEKNSLWGGRCSTYEKNGFMVDVGVHLFAEGPSGPLSEICRRFGEPDAIRWELARNPRPLLNYLGKNYVYSRDTMLSLVPERERKNLLEVFGRMLGMSKKEMDGIYHKNLREWVNNFTKDLTIHTLISGICGQYFCIPTSIASAGEFIRCFQSVVKSRSSGYPYGGCISIPSAYIREIEKRGRAIKKEVKRIVVEDFEVRGVEVEDGFVPSDVVVSNAEPRITLKLAGEKNFPREWRNRIKNLRYAGHVFALKIALKRRITDQKLIMYIPLPIDSFEEYMENLLEGTMPEEVGGMITSPSNFDPSLAPPGKQLLLFGTGAPRKADWDRWKESCMSSLEKLFPEIKEEVEWVDVTTPDTIERFAGEDGNVIGAAQTPEQVGSRRLPQVTPVKGLYLVGAEAGGWGVGAELAARSAIELSQTEMR
jgi:phytoene dehydrogenase-like protein